MGKYKLDVTNLNNIPSCDIFGYLMGRDGITINTEPTKIVEHLISLKHSESVLVEYIDTILNNIIEYGDLEDYLEHLTPHPHEFITCEGELIKVDKS